MLRTTDAVSRGVEIDVSHPVFEGKTPANDVPPPPQSQAVKAAVNAPTTATRTGEIAPIQVNEGGGAQPDPSRIHMTTSGGSGRRPPTPGSVQPSNTPAPSAAEVSPGPPRRVHPNVIPRNELPAKKPASNIDAVIDALIAEEPPIQQPIVPGKRPALAGKFDWEKLPRPKAYQGRGAQAFGIEAIEWGHGEQGANSLMNTIKNNPREAQEYLGRLRSRGITSDMARAWAEPYEQEAMRVPTNKTAKARAALMHLIAERL